MRGGKRKRVKRLHTGTLFSSGKITKLFHQELTSFICAFHSGPSTEWFANYTYPLEMAVAVSCDLSGWWRVWLGHPCCRFFSSLRNCIGVLKSQEVPGCHGWGCASGDGCSGLPRLPVWSLAGGLGLDSGKNGGPLNSGRPPFQLPLTCHLPSVPHVPKGRSPCASSSAAGHSTECLSPE